MTSGTALKLRNALNLILRCQSFADFRLVRRRLPVHVKDLVARTQNRFRVAMAVQAPLHQQRRGLKHQRHLVDLPVTRRAAHAFVDVNAVIEINEVRQAMHADPFDGFIGAETLAHRLQISGVVEQHRVAIHAGLGGRNTGGGGAFHGRMAVTAIDAVVAHVVLMAELDGLLARDVLVRQIRSAGQAHHTPESQGCEQRPEKDTEPRDEIRTAVKNLSHVKFALLR
jgi:hypothetical protein